MQAANFPVTIDWQTDLVDDVVHAKMFEKCVAFAPQKLIHPLLVQVLIGNSVKCLIFALVCRS